MKQSNDKHQGKKQINEEKTFPVPFSLGEIKENISIATNTPAKSSKEQIINQAFTFHSQGKILEAAKYYQYFINQGFKDHRVFSNYGSILKDLGKLREAELSQRKAIELKPDFPEAHCNLGIILKDIGKFKEAELSYRKAIQIYPDFAEAYLNLGIILKDIGKLQEAELSYRKAIQINPDFAEAYLNLGNILQDIDKLKEAELSYRKAIQINPDYAEAYLNLGIILKDIGKLQEAELSYRKAIQIYPDFSNAHYNLGNILKDIGKLQEAEISYRKAIQINPDYAEAYLNLGIILKDIGTLKSAELFCQKAIEINPDLAEAHSNIGMILRDLSKLEDAELSCRKAIEINPDLAEAHSNLGIILRDLSKLKDAESSYNKAIQLNPDLADAHNNLGNALKDLGKLKNAELSYRKTIELNPNYTAAYYSLSLLKYSNNKGWQDRLFSESFLNNQSEKDKINIYFGRANILHKEKNYKESSKYLELANSIKLSIHRSKPELIFNKSKLMLVESDQIDLKKKEHKNFPESIFIVGMPRSGSTLLESILSMGNNVYDLGEINILEESFLEFKKSKKQINLAELYIEKVTNKTTLKIITNKWLYNYQYAGIIARHIPNAKIIHCYRNPLDNILSIYRAHFASGNEYSSSLVDCARVYLDQDDLMAKYKNKFPSKIYDFNYNSLVSNPNQEIKALISWLGWKWDDRYLSPHLNPRSVSTASNVQVRSPINSKSIDGWKNYKDMLQPSIEILTQASRYRNLIS